MLKANNYAAAFEALDASSQVYKSSGEYKSLYALVTSKATEYETSILANVQREADKNNYATALQLLDEALIHYPQSNKLAVKRKGISQEYNHQISLLKAHAAMSEADWLIQERRLQQQLTLKDPSDLTASSNLRQVEQRMEAIATELVGCGVNALRDKDRTLAEQCLAMAQRMSTSEAVQQSIQNLEKKIIAYHTLKRHQEEQKVELASKKKQLAALKKEYSRKQEAHKLLTDARLSLSRNDFRATHELLQMSRQYKFYKKQFVELEDIYNKKLNIRLDKDLQLGINLYKKGQIRDAQQIWKAALELDPAHEELKAHLERANRVLQKLSELRSDTDTDNDKKAVEE